jgi:hypothetical protein
MNELHTYGLVRISKKTGKIDTSMTAVGKGLIQLWALQNTTKTKACVILDLTDRKVFAEYIGTADGFPIVRKSEADFEFDVPEQLFDLLSAEEAERK